MPINNDTMLETRPKSVVPLLSGEQQDQNSPKPHLTNQVQKRPHTPPHSTQAKPPNRARKPTRTSQRRNSLSSESTAPNNTLTEHSHKHGTLISFISWSQQRRGRDGTNAKAANNNRRRASAGGSHEYSYISSSYSGKRQVRRDQ